MDKTNIFDEVDNIKFKAEEEILNNQDLLKLLSETSANPLSKPDIEKPSKLIDKYIYFKPKTYKTIEEVQSFLLMDTIITTTKGKNKFADIKLIFRVIVHNKLFELYDGKTRAYRIAKELKDSFGGEIGTWIGKCEFDDCYPLTVPEDYQGIQMVFTMTDFK